MQRPPSFKLWPVLADAGPPFRIQTTRCFPVPTPRGSSFRHVSVPCVSQQAQLGGLGDTHSPPCDAVSSLLGPASAPSGFGCPTSAALDSVPPTKSLSALRGTNIGSCGDSDRKCFRTDGRQLRRYTQTLSPAMLLVKRHLQRRVGARQPIRSRRAEHRRPHGSYAPRRDATGTLNKEVV